MEKLTLEILQQAVASDVAALRSRIELQPVGGPGDKVFPPTYATGEKNLRYAVEKRRVDGEANISVLLDSVASQANRMEEALQDAWDDGDVDFPVIAVDFSKQPGLEDLDRITTLQAPHRWADALLRDSVDASDTETLFRDTTIGAALTDSSPKNASAVFTACPTALIFGVWDSTGPKGGSGTKFQRALVSEIVGLGCEGGVKVGSRLDPAEIKSLPVYEDKENSSLWTTEANEAALDKKAPKLFSRSGGDKNKKGKPASINHGNIAPSIDALSGGITFDRAEQTVVLSLPALRRLRFRTNAAGEAFEGEQRKNAALAARTALAALALGAVVFQRQRGYDLRSRCALVATGPFVLELVPADGTEPPKFEVTEDEAIALLKEAAALAKAAGLGWTREPMHLVPSARLSVLIRKSRELSKNHEGDDDQTGGS